MKNKVKKKIAKGFLKTKSNFRKQKYSKYAKADLKESKVL